MKNTPFITLVIVVTFITILFFWGESIDVSSSIDAEKFGNYGTLIGAILTAFTVYLLYRQISEMIKDRNAANQPDLYPSESYYETEDYNDMILGPALPMFYRIIDDKRNPTTPSLFMKIHNIGLGAAKEIEISWIYDKEEIERIIEGTYVLKDGGSNNDNQRVDFIPSQAFFDISMPYHYMKACGIRFNQTNIDIALGAFPSAKPNLSLQLFYKDIYNNQYRALYNTDIEAVENRISVKYRKVLR